MADVPNWAMSSASGKTMREISDLIEEMKGCGIMFPRGGFQRKQDAIAFIEEQRGKFWDRHLHRTAIDKIGKVSGKGGRLPITAAECNEFLRSLPPLPLYGEPGCPFNPPRMAQAEYATINHAKAPARNRRGHFFARFQLFPVYSWKFSA